MKHWKYFLTNSKMKKISKKKQLGCMTCVCSSLCEQIRWQHTHMKHRISIRSGKDSNETIWKHVLNKAQPWLKKYRAKKILKKNLSFPYIRCISVSEQYMFETSQNMMSQQYFPLFTLKVSGGKPQNFPETNLPTLAQDNFEIIDMIRNHIWIFGGFFNTKKQQVFFEEKNILFV